ncbi:Threonine dehydratase [Hordeum vulgare]|nr:Threonine dehydratase [Hordeum vulgare]
MSLAVEAQRAEEHPDVRMEVKARIHGSPSASQEQGIPVENTKCLFCGQADEDGGHLFIKCKNAKVVWRELALEAERREMQEIPSVHHALDYIWSLGDHKRMLILTFWWL